MYVNQLNIIYERNAYFESTLEQLVRTFLLQQTKENLTLSSKTE